MAFNLFIYIHSKKWPYGFQESLWNYSKGIPFYAGIIVATVVLYFLGKLANYGIWYHRIKEKERKALLTLKRREAESQIDLKAYGDDNVYQIEDI